MAGIRVLASSRAFSSDSNYRRGAGKGGRVVYCSLLSFSNLPLLLLFLLLLQLILSLTLRMTPVSQKGGRGCSSFRAYSSVCSTTWSQTQTPFLKSLSHSSCNTCSSLERYAPQLVTRLV